MIPSRSDAPRWLFPGRIPGQPLDLHSLNDQLNRHGISVRPARTEPSPRSPPTRPPPSSPTSSASTSTRPSAGSPTVARTGPPTSPHATPTSLPPVTFRRSPVSRSPLADGLPGRLAWLDGGALRSRLLVISDVLCAVLLTCGAWRWCVTSVPGSARTSGPDTRRRVGRGSLAWLCRDSAGRNAVGVAGWGRCQLLWSWSRPSRMKSSAYANSAASSHAPRAPPWVTARAISTT